MRSPSTVNTRTSPHRTLRFESVDAVLAEVDRVIAAERAGTLRQTGNWTSGQVLGHIAAWANYPYEGFPKEMQPPWFVKLIARLLKKRLTYRPMGRGFRIPGIEGGTFGIDVLSTDEGARRIREVFARLKRREPARFHSPVLGQMSDDDRIAINLRHAELHLGFLQP